MPKITIFDSTLRDGSHGIRHQFTKTQIKNYSVLAEKSGIPIIVVGHGNGLGASSIHLGTAKLTDKIMLRTARQELNKTRLGTFVLPGFATLKDMDMAISEGVDVFQVASHCTEATVTKQYIEYAKKKGKEVYGVLMMSHMVDSEILMEQAILMQDYGVQGVLFMDSAGALLPQNVSERVYAIKSVDIKVGHHPHNNLGLAVANALIAVEAGATMLDGTTCGLGAGAGNLPLEVIVPLLHKLGYKTGINEDALFECADYIRSEFPLPKVDPISIVSGLSGVFSGFKPLVLKASKEYGASSYDIFRELGRQKTVAGQEDMVIEIAKELSKT